MFLDYFIKVFQDNKKNDAIIWKGKTYTYDWLLTKYIYWQDVLQSDDIKSGTIVIIEADFSPNAVSLLLALIENGCIVVPITESVSAKKDEFVKIAEGEVLIKIDNNDNVKISELPNTSKHKPVSYTHLTLPTTPYV